MFEAYRKQLIQREKDEIEAHKNEITDFIKWCGEQGLHLSIDDFRYIQTIGVIAQRKDILTLIQSTLIRDKEGLVNWDTANNLYTTKGINEGYLYADNYMAMASPLFRRGMHGVNNWSPRFIQLFWSLDKSNLDAFIALDFDRVRINVNDLCYIEADTWFGAPFQNDIAKIKDGAVKLRPPMDIEPRHISLSFANAYALDIFWYTSKGIKTFQAMEFKDDTITLTKDGKEYHPVRYVHAEYDLDIGEFRHFDGAIQYLTAEEYLSRRDTDFNHNQKADSHIKPMSEKLFKFNGNISVEMWKEFTSHFLTANPLIYEYFSGGQYPDYIENMLRIVRKNSSV